VILHYPNKNDKQSDKEIKIKNEQENKEDDFTIILSSKDNESIGSHQEPSENILEEDKQNQVIIKFNPIRKK
jgi:hypothetical protein